MSSISQLNHLCQVCLSSIDFNEKTLAQQKLAAFLNTMSPKNLSELLNSISESSIFVLISILISKIPQLQEHSQWLTKSIQIYSTWLSNDYTLTVNNKTLSYHIVGKCKQWIGELLKSVYYHVLSDKQKKLKLQNYIMMLRQQLRVFCYIAFLESINLIDYEIGFTSFRNLMFSFQKDWIPLMFKEVSSMLSQLCEADQLRPLILKIQTKLSLDEDSNQSTQEFSDIEFKRITKTTELLQNLTQFHYNIDSNEYDKTIDYFSNPIQFPPQITHIIVKGGLYESAQAVMKRLIAHFPQHPIVETFLRCFMKISSPSSSNTSFKKSCIEMCMFIMCHNSNTNIFYLLLEFNLRLIRTIPFSSFFLQNQQLMVKWIKLLMELSQWVFKNTHVTFKNPHIDNIARIFNTIFQGSAKKDLIDHKPSFKTISEAIFMKFCNFLFSSNKSLVCQNVLDLKEMKAKNQEEFNPWIPTLFLSALNNYQIIRKVQISIYSTPENINNILNFNLLIGYLVTYYSDFFYENVHYEEITSQTKHALGQIIKSSLQFLPTIKNGSVPLQGSVLYFYSSFISTVINSFQYSEQTTSSFIQQFIPQIKSTSTESIIMECIRQIGNRLSIPNYDIIKYSFEILYENTESLNKHYEQSFTSSTLYQQLLNFYLTLASNSLKVKSVLRGRKYLFKNITTLTLYQNQSSISQTINGIIGIISRSEYESDLIKLFAQIYDIRGMTLVVKDDHYLEQFIQIILPMMDNLNKIVFGSLVDAEIRRETLKIYNTLFRNEAKRKSQVIMVTIYQLILPHWASMLNQFNRLEEKMMQKDLDIILQIVVGVTELFRRPSVSPFNARDFSGLISAVLTSCVRISSILQKIFADSMLVVKLFEVLATREMMQSICQLFDKNQICLFFNFHVFIFRFLLQQLKALVNKQKQQTLKDMEPVNIITNGMIEIYTLIRNRCLEIPKNLKSLRPNRIQQILETFLSFNNGIMIEIIIEFFKICCLAPRQQGQTSLFDCSVGILICLVPAYPGSKEQVINQFRKQTMSPSMEQKLELIYMRSKMNRHNEESIEESECSFMRREASLSHDNFDLMIKDWIMALDKAEFLIDDY